MKRLLKSVPAVLFLLTVGLLPTTASAKKLSHSEPLVTQLKIVHSGTGITEKTPTSWGINSNYIGPGDINRLVSVDIYLDGEKRIAYIKIKRETYTGDVATLLFSDVKEISIQTLLKGSKKPAKKVKISVYTADSLTFP